MRFGARAQDEKDFKPGIGQSFTLPASRGVFIPLEVVAGSFTLLFAPRLCTAVHGVGTTVLTLLFTDVNLEPKGVG